MGEDVPLRTGNSEESLEPSGSGSSFNRDAVTAVTPEVRHSGLPVHTSGARSAVEEIYSRCMQGSVRGLVKGGLILEYTRHPFSVWCNTFAPKAERDPESAYMNMIFEAGRNYEDEVCERLYSGALSLDPRLYEKAFLSGLEGFFRGEKFIRNGIMYYLPGRMVAVPDVLVKKEGPSLFGDWHYEVVEVKSSSQVRQEHVMQAAYYTYCIGIIQGYTPEKFTLINGKMEMSEYEYSNYAGKVQSAIAGILDIFSGTAVQPEKLSWPWRSYSIKRLKEEKSISLIPNLYSAHREILHKNGISTLEDFFTLKVMGVTGINFETLERYRRYAKALVNGKHMFIEKPYLPEGRAEIFLDFEGAESVKQGEKIGDYLIGLVLRENGKEAYYHFVSERPENEHKMLIEFLKFLKNLEQDFIIYHFGAYEKSKLSRLFQVYGITDKLAEKVLGSMVDVLQLARKSVIFPVHSYGLKEIGKYLGCNWTAVDDAKDSIALYLDFLQSGNRASLEKIIEYNKDDCLALKRVKDFLVWGV